jgi:hypothetical protein
MKTQIVSGRRGRWLCAAPLAALLLLGACDRPEPMAPEAASPVAPAEPGLVAQVVFEVDPASGAVRMLDSETRGGGGESGALAVPVTSAHV